MLDSIWLEETTINISTVNILRQVCQQVLCCHDSKFLIISKVT